MNPVVSSPQFEIWLLCHFKHSTGSYKSGAEIESELRKQLGREYKKGEPIYNRICNRTDGAIRNAKRLEAHHCEDGLEQGNIRKNPSTDVYIVFEHLKSFCN